MNSLAPVAVAEHRHGVDLVFLVDGAGVLVELVLGYRDLAQVLDTLRRASPLYGRRSVRGLMPKGGQ
jgi:hypothetical protein